MVYLIFPFINLFINREKKEILSDTNKVILKIQEDLSFSEIGDYLVPFNSEEREPWKIISDNSLLFKTLDEEQTRSYGKYSKSPSTEKEVREKFEKKALMEAEEETWKLIKDSDNKDDLEYFIKQFPNSPYTIPAKLKLNQLNKN